MLRVLGGGAQGLNAVLASGDEDGGLKLWDVRTRKQVRGCTQCLHVQQGLCTEIDGIAGVLALM
jgi:hypothetical protein